MAELIELQSPRLVLRQWRASDLEPFAALNADPVVMEYFPACLTRAQSDALAARIQAHFDQHGFGLWALERQDSGAFIGFTGLLQVGFTAAFTPAVEIGWRLAREHWGQGFAREAAQAALACGFARLQLAELVSFTVPANRRSRAVMAALGMQHDPQDDFDHPTLPLGHPLRRHVLYRLNREQWLEQRQ
ncbi:N-acetyltransferase [Pseudomonas cavernicola]|uniref:N-acetyltransferase n=1 Tax=Pseudomonas cavernicola TaxID=2320866 RepID=A0A418XPE2_9PSED|nr:GNAT family N-acetyltransferase [Pseudomonas cavernicola]RJG14305.1 N-acetyltransferase [Pseudomonas cavernicola]